MPEYSIHGISVLRPFGAGGAFSAVKFANARKRPMNSSFVARPTNVDGCGVMFAVTTRNHGVCISHPPANSFPGIGFPFASFGVWHSATCVRYLPYAR